MIQKLCTILRNTTRELSHWHNWRKEASDEYATSTGAEQTEATIVTANQTIAEAATAQEELVVAAEVAIKAMQNMRTGAFRGATARLRAAIKPFRS